MPGNNPFSTESVVNAAGNTRIENANQQDLYNITSESLAVLKDLRSGIDDLNDALQDSKYRTDYYSQSNVKSFKADYDSQYRTTGRKSAKKGFTDAFEDELLKGLFGSSFRDGVANSLTKFATSLGTDLEGLSATLGTQIAKIGLDAIKSTRMGAKITGTLSGGYTNFFKAVDNKLAKASELIQDPEAGAKLVSAIQTYSAQGVSAANLAASAAKSAAIEGAGVAKAAASTAKSSIAATVNSGSVLGNVLNAASKGFKFATSSLSNFTKTLGVVGLAFGAAVVAVKLASKALGYFKDNLKTSWEGVKKLFSSFIAGSNRYQEIREKNLKLAQDRLVKDTETMVKRPFEILEDAANTLYQTWNSNLATISTTQQYTKADVQDLISGFAQRLQSEGLSKYVSSADITDNLSKVLESGLSGAVAEEFAYLATVLHAALPTQDFFNYASTYASIAANAIKQGATQQVAIQKANDSLATFASGLLYAGRELAGGFTTGLQDAQTLFEQATKIAQASKTGNINDIAGVLLAVRGEVGAVAPDLAASITDTIYQTLTGGNSSNLVALRSLAGVNASNTEFLKAVANNPKAVFSAMFSNLGRMYTQSPDAYMEKAEGYAQLFGLSSEAFQRVDFNSLASAISSMNMNNGELAENMKLLLEGQTTTSDEQLKMQQINQFMIDEGLSLVIDNQAAQFIQQHMWEEQMNRELMENTFVVNLAGESAEAIEMIRKGINNVLKFLHPSSWFQSVENMVLTKLEQPAQKEDIRRLLETTKVGRGNSLEMYQLTHLNEDLQVVPNLLSLLGSRSAYATLERTRRGLNYQNNSYLETHGAYSDGYGRSSATKSAGIWALSALQNLASNTQKLVKSSRENITYAITSAGNKAASTSASIVEASLNKMLSDDYLVNNFIKKNKTYNEWAATASSFGIKDLDAALASVGKSSKDIMQYFQDRETEQGLKEQHEIREHEKLFRETGISFWTDTFFHEYKDPLFDLFEINNTHLAEIIKNQLDWQAFFQKEWLEKGWTAYVSMGASGNGIFNKFYNEFMKYFINHTYYSSTAGYKYSDVEAIQKKAKQQERGDTVYALAEMLTKNLVDLKDPTVQTNAILSQILIVVSAIMNQNNELGGSKGQSTLLDSLSAMALGLTANSAG